MWGIGVMSRIDFTSTPAAVKARMADSRPLPGPWMRTSTDLSPWSLALVAAVVAACWAAKGVPFREPLKPMLPELDQAITLPAASVMVILVLLKEA